MLPVNAVNWLICSGYWVHMVSYTGFMQLWVKHWPVLG